MSKSTLPSWRNWQTRMVQVHVPATVWGFESLRWHQQTEVRRAGLCLRPSKNLKAQSALRNRAENAEAGLAPSGGLSALGASFPDQFLFFFFAGLFGFAFRCGGLASPKTRAEILST